jgi:hypothetical protein
VMLSKVGRRRRRELNGYMHGDKLLRLGLRHDDEQPGVEGDGELAPGEAGRRRRAARCFGPARRNASDGGAASDSSVGEARGAWWRRGSDTWASARKAETNRWDPAAEYFQIKNTPEMKLAKK